MNAPSDLLYLKGTVDDCVLLIIFRLSSWYLVQGRLNLKGCVTEWQNAPLASLIAVRSILQLIGSVRSRASVHAQVWECQHTTYDILVTYYRDITSQNHKKSVYSLVSTFKIDNDVFEIFFFLSNVKKYGLKFWIS